MSRFPSHAQQGEDVVLWRALHHVRCGRYIEVGANDPTVMSITRSFYDAGWRGITIEPVKAFADKHRADRPEDTLIEAAITSRSGETVTLYEIPDTGLSTLVEDVSSRHHKAGWDVHEVEVRTRTLTDVLTEVGWADDDIHFMTVDVEGVEEDVLAGMDFTRWRPWVLVVESTQPLSTEQRYSSWEQLLLDAGYVFCLFDGLSRFYVAEEHREELQAKLSYPAGGLDDYTTPDFRRMEELLQDNQQLREANDHLAQLVIRWRAASLDRWAAGTEVQERNNLVSALQEEIDAIHASVSWKVTGPLRTVRRVGNPVPAMHQLSNAITSRIETHEPGGELAARLRAAAEALQVDVPPEEADTRRDASVVLPCLVAAVKDDLTAPNVWLLHTALTASFPTADAIREALRAFELSDADEAELWILDRWLDDAAHEGVVPSEMQVVTGQVVLDVSHTSGSDLHTGIQRVVRSTTPEWAELGEFQTVRWTDDWTAYRSLTALETRRVADWDGYHADRTNAGVDTDAQDSEPVLVVPWRCTVVLAESVEEDALARLAGMAELSGNDLVAIGYDVIPAVSADQVPVALADQFLRFLTVIKHTKRVAAISALAAEEFSGFTEMLANQGLPGPEVTVVKLPSPQMDMAPSIPGGCPKVLMVGSFEPRKNYLAALYAAERLWAEGHDFELHMVGGMSWTREIPAEISRLEALGRPVHRYVGIGDAELNRQYRGARFSMFISTHEGYGLPVVESLAAGTPVLASATGSVGELASAGGCLVIDPRDDEAIVDGMRRMLTDDDFLMALAEEIAKRPSSTWADYAAESWRVLVGDKASTEREATRS